MNNLVEKISAAEEYLKTPLSELAGRKDADLKFHRATFFIPESNDAALDLCGKLFEANTISCTKVTSVKPDKSGEEIFYKLIVDCSYLDKVSMYVTDSREMHYPYFIYPIVSEFLPKQGFDLFLDEDEKVEVFKKNPMVDFMLAVYELEDEMHLNINKLREVEGYEKAQELIAKYNAAKKEYFESLTYTEVDFESKIPFMV